MKTHYLNRMVSVETSKPKLRVEKMRLYKSKDLLDLYIFKNRDNIIK